APGSGRPAGGRMEYGEIHGMGNDMQEIRILAVMAKQAGFAFSEHGHDLDPGILQEGFPAGADQAREQDAPLGDVGAVPFQPGSMVDDPVAAPYAAPKEHGGIERG